MTGEDRHHVLIKPLCIWAALMALLVLTIVYAFVPGLPFKTEAGLGIAVAKALLIALLFMQLKGASGIVRIAAVAGLVWASFLYVLTFADLLTR
jgi:cytochrome c oxidase subunit 4